MGLDLFLAIQMTDEQIQRVPSDIELRPFQGETPFKADGQGYLDDLKPHDNGGTWYEPQTMLRWYGPGYERGHWPITRAFITRLFGYSDIVVVRWEELWFMDARQMLIDGDRAYAETAAKQAQAANADA